MIDLFQARRESHEARELGHEFKIQEGGVSLEVPRVEGQALYPSGDAPRMTRDGTPMENIKEGLADLPKAVGSAGAGVAAGVAGLPGDVVSLIGGLGSALFPGDQSRLEAFTTTMTDISEAIGSERFLGLYTDIVNNGGFSEEDKKMMLDVAEGASFFSIPGAATVAKGSSDAIRSGVVKAGEAAQARLDEAAGSTTLAAGVDPDPLIAAVGRAVAPDRAAIKNVLDTMANEMKKPAQNRIQPKMDEPLFNVQLTEGANDNPYLKTVAEQKETPVPRAPEGAKLPKKNRGAKVVEMSDQIAEVLADRARPFLGTNVQYFYHTGPLIEKAVDLGVSEDVARAQLRKFAENYAATSPRTRTTENVRHASLVTAKQSADIPIDEIIGVGSGGLNEKGYPMMISPGGIHRQLIEDAAAGGFDFNTNPKPATFVENVAGNHAGVTADTHAIRAVFDAMNEIEPGSVPLGFIGGKQTKTMKAPAVRDMNQKKYQDDPSSLDVASMIDDTLNSQMVDGVRMQTEYAIFSDIYKKVAEKLGVSPAEAQSLSWFANGQKTGLGSDAKTIVELIDERVDVTAQALNQSKEDVFKKFMQGSIPLMSLGGLTLLDTGAAETMVEDGDI